MLAGFLAAGWLPVLAKLPAPSPEAQAKADETKAKTAHGDKVAAYKLCLAGDRTAAHYFKTVGSNVKPPAATTPPCTDPGPFVYVPPAAAAAVASQPSVTPPLEAAGAHSPAKTATAPPSGKATAAEQTGTARK
ncbi:MAG: hypothetical protein K2Y02_12305 [Burkholderiaceae bacterium]|nr:hypothetical protein [Burkholderiaceae bacterium]